MIKYGEVKDRKENKFKILTYPSSDCKDCNICEAEHELLIAEDYCYKDIKIGDKVAVKYENKYSYLIFLIYFIPILFLLIGGVVTNILFQNENLTVLISFIFFTLGIFFVKFLGSKNMKKIIPEIKKIE